MFNNIRKNTLTNIEDLNYNNIVNDLVIPVYINDKIVFDMLAISEDGFSSVSQVNYSKHIEENTKKDFNAGLSTSATILSKLLKVNLSGNINNKRKKGTEQSTKMEKIHTNVSLLSKFRNLLLTKNALKTEFNVKEILIGDFIEIEGELQKNPLIHFLEIVIDLFRLANIFTDKPQLGEKKQSSKIKQEENELVKQIKSFIEELKHTGTIDFILSNDNKTIVLSLQEKYLSNDNISELIGGRFKILGKVIGICKDETESINLLRKSSLTVLSNDMLNDMFACFEQKEFEEFNLPEFKATINGPAIIVIPIAIYA